jgi:hypothetical protein
MSALPGEEYNMRQILRANAIARRRTKKSPSSSRQGCHGFNIHDPYRHLQGERKMTAQPEASDWYPDLSIKHKLIAEPTQKARRSNRYIAVIGALCVAFAFLFGSAAFAGPAPSAAPASAPAYRLVSFGGSYVRTSWGVSCEVASDHVTCQSCIPGQRITNAYTCSDPTPGVAVSAAGIVDHNAGTIASAPDSQSLADGQTYHANGWTIVASGGWARFINDATGHGMAVAPQNFDSF